MSALVDRSWSILLGAATAVVVVTVAVLPFLTPQWVAFEQGRSNAMAWTGYAADELRAATDAILSDLVIGPSEFDVTVRGEGVLDDSERSHMREVRSVFVGLWVLAAASVVLLLVAGRRSDRRRFWRSIGRGAIGLASAIVVIGVVALVAFDVLFEFFHRLLFPAGSYTFDPATQRLVQLFPFQFWEETAVVVGVVIIVIAVGLARIARRRAVAAVA